MPRLGERHTQNQIKNGKMRFYYPVILCIFIVFIIIILCYKCGCGCKMNETHNLKTFYFYFIEKRKKFIAGQFLLVVERSRQRRRHNDDYDDSNHNFLNVLCLNLSACDLNNVLRIALDGRTNFLASPFYLSFQTDV